jgi:hypothetical protein
MNTARILVVIVVLQGLILMGQWTGSGPLTPAQAQVPDAGAQRIQMIEELRRLNGKMDALVEKLESGKLQVQVEAKAEKKE